VLEGVVDPRLDRQIRRHRHPEQHADRPERRRHVGRISEAVERYGVDEALDASIGSGDFSHSVAELIAAGLADGL
jgi:hypothetical protein